MKAIISDEESFRNSAFIRSMSPDGDDTLLLSEYSSQGNLESPQSASGHIMILWQIFLDRVEPLTKIVHIPSIQPYVVQSTNTSVQLPANIETLLFSICSIALVSLDDVECARIFGSARKGMLRHYTALFRTALIRAKYLRTSDLVVLQALTLHLV